jgi:hypothetical protein
VKAVLSRKWISLYLLHQEKNFSWRQMSRSKWTHSVRAVTGTTVAAYFAPGVNAILSVLIIHSIPSRQIYVAIDNPLFVPSVSCLTCTNFETGSKIFEFSGIVVSARATQNSTKASSLYRSLILNFCCSCHRRRPFSLPYHLPGSCLTHPHSFCRSPPHVLCVPVHRHI